MEGLRLEMTMHFLWMFFLWTGSWKQDYRFYAHKNVDRWRILINNSSSQLGFTYISQDFKNCEIKLNMTEEDEIKALPRN